MNSDKNMPFFKFDPFLWLKGKVQFLSMEERGIFIELTVRLWVENGSVLNDEFLHKFLRVEKGTLSSALQVFLKLGIVEENNGFLSVKFINKQITERLNYLENQRQIGAKGGRPKKGTKPKQKAESRKQREELNPPISPKGENPACDKLLIQSSERILKKHPNVKMPIPSTADIHAAILREFDKPPVKTIEQAIEFIENRTILYASIVAQWPPGEQRFIAGSNNWYAGGGYLESEDQWKLRITQGNQGNGANNINSAKHVETVRTDPSKREIPGCQAD